MSGNLIHVVIFAGWRVPSVDHAWIGGHYVSGRWVWEGLITGPLTVTKFSPGEPNYDGNRQGLCVLTWGAQAMWGDNPCELARPYVCERKLV